MKSIKQVCEKLEPRYRALLDAYRFEGEVGQDVLSYNDFERTMMADGFILSVSTIQTKWRILESSGIIKCIGKGKAFVNVAPLAKTLGYNVVTDEKKIKKNIFSEQEAEEVQI